jgi:hypothetical protein
MPRRITFNRYAGKLLPDGAALVTRATRWGNPFKVIPREPTGGYIVRWAGKTTPPIGTEPYYFAYRAATGEDRS